MATCPGRSPSDCFNCNGRCWWFSYRFFFSIDAAMRFYKQKNPSPDCSSDGLHLVGVAGLELATSWTPFKHATSNLIRYLANLPLKNTNYLLANFFELRNKQSFTALAPEGDLLNDTTFATTFEYRPACTTNNTNLRAILFSKFFRAFFLRSARSWFLWL